MPAEFKINGRNVTLGGCLLVCLLFGGCCGGCAMMPEMSYSDGERTGTITKFSHKGLIWKTYEGEMSLGGFRNSSDGKSVEANVWEFSVDKNNAELVKEIEDAQHAGGTYTLHYRQVFFAKPWNSATGYYVTKVVPQGK